MADASLRIAGLYKNLNTIARFVTEWAVKTGFDDRAVYALQMAVDEACSNIIEHAYGGEGKGDIVLECTPKDDGLLVKIVDFGVAFEPEAIAALDVAAHPGLGRARALGPGAPGGLRLGGGQGHQGDAEDDEQLLEHLTRSFLRLPVLPSPVVAFG